MSLSPFVFNSGSREKEASFPFSQDGGRVGKRKWCSLRLRRPRSVVVSGANYFSCEKYKKQMESGVSSAINPGEGETTRRRKLASGKRS